MEKGEGTKQKKRIDQSDQSHFDFPFSTSISFFTSTQRRQSPSSSRVPTRELRESASLMRECRTHITAPNGRASLKHD